MTKGALKRLPVLLLGLILLLAAWLRFYNLYLTQFADDQYSTVTAVIGMLQGGGIPLVGMPTQIDGLHHGALTTYLFALPLALSHDLGVVSGFIVLLNLLAVLLTYRFTRLYFGVRAALLATLLFAVNPWAVYFSRKIWNPDLCALFTLLFFIAVFAVVVRKQRWQFALAAFWLACMIQVHFVSLDYFPLLLAIGLLCYRRIRLGPVLLGSGLGLLVFAPYVLYEWQKRWQDLATTAHVVTNGSTIDWQAVIHSTTLASAANFPEIFGDYTLAPIRQAYWIYPLIYPFELIEQVLLWAAVLFLAGVVANWLRKVLLTGRTAGVPVRGPAADTRPDTTGLPLPPEMAVLLLLWFLLPLLAFTRHGRPVFQYYFLQMLPVPFILIGLVLDLAMTRWLRAAGRRVAGYVTNWPAGSWIARAVTAYGPVLCGLYLACLTAGHISSTLLLYRFEERQPFTVSDRLSVQAYLNLFERVRRYASTGATVYLVTDEGGPPELEYMIAWRKPPLQVLKGQYYVVFPGAQRRSAYYIVPALPSRAARLLSRFPDHELPGEAFPEPGLPNSFKIYHFDSFGASELERLTRFTADSTAPLTPSAQLFNNGLILTHTLVEKQDSEITFSSIATVSRVQAGQPAYSFSYTLRDSSGHSWSEWESPVYPSAFWNQGDTLVHWSSSSVAGLGAGKYSLEAGLYRLSNGSLLALSPRPGQPAADRLQVGSVIIHSPPRSVESLHPQHPLDLQFGSQLRLLGYDLPGSLAKPGQSLRVTFYWQAQGPISRDYTLFLHLFDPQGHLVAQLDTQPAQGRYPTSAWDAGEIVVDSLTLPLDPSLPASTCQLNIGFYTLPEIRRLPITDQTGKSLGDSMLIPVPIAY